MAKLLKGAPVANALTESLTERANRLIALGITPTLAILRVGENGSDLSYERNAIKRCEKIGIRTISYALPESWSQADVMDKIAFINESASIHGCLMFRPLPKQLDERAVCEALCPDKDIDCVTSASLAGVMTGNATGFPPCTAQACLEILDHYGYDPAGRNVAVIGRSLVIGKPVSLMLQSRNATVTMCHTKTRNMAELCARAEILVVAAGRAGVVSELFTNPDQVVVDVGINTMPDGSLCGDVDFAKVEPCVEAITPVPGGVGGVTTAVLCKYVIEAAEKAKP